VIILSVIMSTKSEQLEGELEGAEDEVCAACGTAAVDDVTLKKCACNLVKYCSVDCQKNHRSRHKKACKKRLAEMHDKQLFEQPDISHMGECPICCLPLSIDPRKSNLMPCCCKVICNGCSYANKKREIEAGLEHICAFCREPLSESDEECIKRTMERVKKNDTVAMTQMGKKHYGEGDSRRALEYWTKAAELGDAEAHFALGSMYYQGKGVEKDEKKALPHLEQAAIGGHPGARGLLAAQEMKNFRFDRGKKHQIIAANLGCDFALQEVKDMFVRWVISKEEHDAALRGYQAALNATKSAERDEAEAYCTRHNIG
jgi:tetratricopeptide (TPR) repeat protein